LTQILGQPCEFQVSALYHDVYPGISPVGDCGGVTCGEYLYDHRNESLRAFIVDTIVGGPDAMGNDAVNGIFLDVRTI
jgi:hypothetical protein